MGLNIIRTGQICVQTNGNGDEDFLADIKSEAVLLVAAHVGVRHEEEGILVLATALR